MLHCCFKNNNKNHEPGFTNVGRRKLKSNPKPTSNLNGKNLCKNKKKKNKIKSAIKNLVGGQLKACVCTSVCLCVCVIELVMLNLRPQLNINTLETHTRNTRSHSRTTLSRSKTRCNSLTVIVAAIGFVV